MIVIRGKLLKWEILNQGAKIVCRAYSGTFYDCRNIPSVRSKYCSDFYESKTLVLYLN